MLCGCFRPLSWADYVRQQYFLSLSCYIRGEAYLAAGQATLPQPSFKKFSTTAASLELLDGSAGASGSGAGERFAGENSQGADADAARVRALAAYKDFLTLWKDADPDIPILKEAKAEYAKLQ